MFFESKTIKVMAYLISIVPIVLSIVPMGEKQTLVFSATMVSFGLTIILEFLSTFLNKHKEQSVLLSQLYEAGITGCTFSKIEYDSEMTNGLNELAIRKAEAKISSLKEFHVQYVPREIDDKYSYFYICRTNAASNNFLMSRMYAVYICALILIISIFTSFAFVKHNTFEFLQLIIQFYPLILPVIRNINSCQKAMRYYTKVSADIDNYFAAKNKSSEKRASFVYYIQNLEFEAMMATPAKYAIFSKIFSGGLKRLSRGVTNRFIDGIEQLEGTKKKKLDPAPLKNKKEKKKDDKPIEVKKTEKVESNKERAKESQGKGKAEVGKETAVKRQTKKVAELEKSPKSKTENKAIKKK